MTEGARILVVDDEHYLADLAANALRRAGFQAEVAGTGGAALAVGLSRRPDLLVLDLRLAKGPGGSLADQLRRFGCSIPVLFLLGRDATQQDKITGLSVPGADYLGKPFSLGELVARCRAALRRSTGAGSPLLSCAGLRLDEDAHLVLRDETRVDLSPTEFRLLRHLLTHQNRVLTKQHILDHVWEYDYAGEDSVVPTYISYLRRKVDARREPMIHTIPRTGYVLRPPTPPAGPS
ncbi:response regulator transcription factor [Crossiella cryophila]|uniref:Two-component system OmpR family response regulator n=1 Tax=Crossiella cryophila TaxID=43355 RepID=A0A7W7CJ26_9PSEU|nr:response regulator transcription factor [Crossiella cryophila]MBB4682150.1 two-component system OmpR family response regulator [Crossiella cryophila]